MKSIPETKQFSSKSITQLRVSRRNFVKNAIALGLFASSGFLVSCLNDDEEGILSESEEKTLISVQNILFPKDVHGPGAYEVNAHNYVKWFLADSRLDPDERNYVINGLKWVNEAAQETFEKNYLDLSKQQQVDLIYKISKKSWGENWLSVMLTYIFEAMISDPIYGFNKDEIGWNWLNYQAGFPRPTQDLKYDTIFKTLHKNNPYE